MRRNAAPKPAPGCRTRVLIADDHPLFREGLVQILGLEGDLVCCGEADSVAGTRRAVEALKPDLLILDLRLRDGDGLELIQLLMTRDPALRILVLSQLDETLYAESVLRAGARGYVMKEEASIEVRRAIRSILKGELFVSRKVSALVLRRHLSKESGTPGGSVSRLSDRERQVFRRIGSGMATSQIAAELNLSVKTVEAHRENIKHKLGLRSVVDLLCHATKWVHGFAGGDPGPSGADPGPPRKRP